MTASPPQSDSSRRFSIGTFWGALALSSLLLLGFELPVWLDPGQRAERLTGWLCGREADWLPYLPVLLLIPLLHFGLRDRHRRGGVLSRLGPVLTNRSGDSLTVAWLCAAGVFVTAFAASHWVAAGFQGMPPAYHDEYSYLFQAQTFLAGRWWFPSFAPDPTLFDQMHVLNEGRFASRYFPGTGAWIAPFLWGGNPWLGHQLAHALAAMFVFWTGRELSQAGVGLLAGMLLALSPGVLLFSSLLLAHHPTLMGLLGFLYGYIRWCRTRELVVLTLAGCGLAFAMLCRPMTAAGFALPMGVTFVKYWLGDRTISWRQRTLAASGLGIPLVAGALILLWSNERITGSVWTSPYQIYTDFYTPRHVYGFNNVLRGEQHLGPKVLDAYDRWAKNLTSALALENVGTRLLNSFRWTLGVIPLTFGLAVWSLTQKGYDRRWLLIAGSVVTLHAVHLPYWFAGIMGWHYVFESAPLLLLLFAEGISRLISASREPGRRSLAWTAAMMVAIALLTNLQTVRPLWPGALPRGMAEVDRPRRQYAVFRDAVERLRQRRDALILVIPDPADISMDYVTNPPDLSGPVLVAHLRDRSQAEQAARLFPERAVWIYDAASKQFRELVPSQESRLP